MKSDIENYMQLDRIVHEPARLLILTLLAETDEMEFRFLEEISGLTKGNLSGHISKLEDTDRDKDTTPHNDAIARNSKAEY